MSAVVNKPVKARRVTGKMVAAAARKYSGVPIIEGGRDRATGIGWLNPGRRAGEKTAIRESCCQNK